MDNTHENKVLAEYYKAAVEVADSTIAHRVAMGKYDAINEEKVPDGLAFDEDISLRILRMVSAQEAALEVDRTFYKLQIATLVYTKAKNDKLITERVVDDGSVENT